MLQLNKKMIAVYAAVIFFVGIDRFLKILALMHQTEQFKLIGDVLKFRYQANYNIAFSLPLGGKWLALLIFLIILILISFGLYYYQRNEYLRSISLSLVILGASSNLFDRVRYGFVIDYFNLIFFSIFNLADAMIVTGIILLIIITYKKEAS